jgi:hypothetical protein
MRWPWLDKICILCRKIHTLADSPYCPKCVERVAKGKVNDAEIKLARTRLQFQIREETCVKYELRYDKQNSLRMATPVVLPRRNNESINSHNRDQTLTNNGNTDLSLCFNPGQVAAYIIGYLCKAKTNIKVIEDVIRRVGESFSEDGARDDTPAAVFVQRCVNAAIAGQSYSGQNAAWNIMQYPVIDTNLRFLSVSLDGQQHAVDLEPDTDDPHISKKHIKSIDFKEAYSLRHTNTTDYLASLFCFDHNRIQSPFLS